MSRWEIADICSTLLSVDQRRILVTAIPLTCLFTSLLAVAWLKTTMIASDAEVQEAQRVQIETKQLLTALLNAEDNMQSYGLTQRGEFLNDYRASLAEISDSLADLAPLVTDSDQQRQNLDRIRELVDRSLAIMQKKINLQQDLNQHKVREELVMPTALLYTWLEEGEDTFNATYAQINLFAQVEDQLLEVRKDRQEFYRQITWSVLCLAAVIGTVGGVLSIFLFRQIEHERAMQQISLQQTNQKLEAVCDQLQRFTASASHELRAPLAAMMSNAQVALIDPSEDTNTLRQHLKKIADLTKSMSTLVNDLLFLARQGGALEPELLQPIDLVKLLQPLADEWTMQANSKSLKFSFQFSPTWISIHADPSLLRQAVNNLLSNAYYYTPVGGSIYLRLSQVDQVLIEVEDDGVGIPEVDLPYIFEPFYRVDKSRSRAKGRFGLGLAITQQIIHAHQGTLAVESRIGQGSVFRVMLPCAIRSN